MKGPTYIDKNPYNQKYQEYSMDIHYKKLAFIKTNKSKLIDQSPPESYKLKRKPVPKNYYNDQDVYRQNQCLLEKLVSLTGHKTNKNYINHSGLFPRSMNQMQRKKDEEKISSQNKMIANRLARISPFINRKIEEKEYYEHVKYKNNLCKLEISPKIMEKKARIYSVTEIPSQKSLLSQSPLPYMRNPYKDEDNIIRKEWKVAALTPGPSSAYMIAIPIALSPILQFN